MNNDTTWADGAPLERQVRPRAWAIFVDGGNARMWSTLQPHVQKLADAEGLEVTPLYDRAAIDAAVAAERVQIAARIREAWHQREASHGNRAGEYHEGMLAGLDAAVALALGPNARLSGGPLGPSA